MSAREDHAPRVELHLHSTVSDGTLSPEELARRAAKAELEVVALTDHDATDGVAAFAAAAAKLGVRAVPALELTARVLPTAHGTVHLLGFGVDLAHPGLQAAARKNRLAKRGQVDGIFRRLAEEEGITLGLEDVAPGRAPDAYVGRNHVASELLRRGLAKTHKHAFERYLEARRVPKLDAIPAAEAVAAIKAAGGLCVLAHPTHHDLDHHLRPLLDLGLDGLEVWRPRAVGGLLARIERAMAEHRLLATGGSDWHGHYPEAPFGTWRLPRERVLPFLEALDRGAARPEPLAPGAMGR